MLQQGQVFRHTEERSVWAYVQRVVSRPSGMRATHAVFYAS